MKILMINTQGSGVGHYRHWAPAKALIAKGHEVWFAEDTGWALDNFILDPFLEEKAAWADIIHTGFTSNISYIEKLATARNYAAQVLKKQLPIVVDIDDDIFHVPAYNVGFKPYATGEAKRAVILNLRLADAVTVTTQALAEAYDPLNYHVKILPNCIQPEAWQDLQVDPARSQSQDVRLAFAGGIGRKADLDLIRPAIEMVMRTRPQARLLFFAMMPDWAQELYASNATDPFANRAFFVSAMDLHDYRRGLAWEGIDICLAPVVSNQFNAGKSHIKILEAPFYGAASVCSDFVTYDTVPPEAVLKASTTYEWQESLLALIDDPTLRAKKVSASRDFFLSNYNIYDNIDRWIAVYEEALSRPVIDSDGNGIKEPQLIQPASPQEVAIVNHSSLVRPG